MMITKTLSLALLLGMFTAALAQTPPRQIELNPEWKPPSANVLNAWKAARLASEAEIAALAKWESEVWLPFRAKHSSVAMP